MLAFGSVCSGIEAATVAWAPLGWEAAFYSEVDPFPRAVLAHHYPETPCHGDFTSIRDGDYRAIDLLVGGTPCQSFSVAGLRAGLDDERGNLAREYLGLAARLRPRWVVWENVPGVLSSHGGRDFGSLVGALGELGYGFAYRVLDAQYFGVAQRRRRVFVVGYLGDWRRAAAVLFERESLSRNPAPRRDSPPGIAARIEGDAGDGDGLIAAFGGNNTSGPIDLATAVNAHGGPHGRLDFESETFVAHSLVPFDTTQITSAANYSNPKAGDPCHRLAATAHPPAVAYAIQERAVCENPNAGPDGKGFRGDGAAYTLEARTVPQAVAFALRGRDGGAMPEVTGDHVSALRAAPGGSSRDYVGGMLSGVRRLTPRECERLQGFPDDYTLIPWRKAMATDGQRYKAVGNSMAVPVMRWIGERIALVDAMREAA